MKPTAVTHRLSTRLLSRVDRLVRLINSEEVGKRSRSAVLREALEIGVSKLERRSLAPSAVPARSLAELVGEIFEGPGH